MKAEGFIGFRVDDRMIHGIVATQWIPSLSATRAMLIDDDIPKNELLRSTMKMAVPAGVALSIIDHQKALTNISNGNYKNQRVFCVFRTIQDAYRIIKAGIEIPELNLGNVTQNSGETLVLGKTVRVSKAEQKMLKEIQELGTRIIIQFSISDQAVNITEKLR